MELRRELLVTIGVIVALNVVLAFGAIGLFARMGPAIERILEENVYSIVAAEQILADFANAGDGPLSPSARGRVRLALDNAAKNVTENAERAELDAIERSLSAAMNGDAEARREIVRHTQELISINRNAMGAVDEEARRLGSAGAWAAVAVGFLSFLLSLLAVSRLQRRVVLPLAELYQVLESAREGERLRRCRTWDAPREIALVTSAVNELLDERLRRTSKGTIEVEEKSE